MKEPLYAIATLVDRRYRGKLLSTADLEAATQRLTDLAASVDDAAPQPDTSNSNVAQPAAKRPRLEEALHWTCWTWSSRLRPTSRLLMK